jgi:protein SCO1
MSKQTVTVAAGERARAIGRSAARLAWALSATGLLCAAGAGAGDGSETDPHARHLQMMQALPAVTRSTAAYRVPDISMVRSDGAHVNLAQELNDSRPVLLNFIYTTCTTTCPVLSQTFAEVQRRLGAQASSVRMVSVSIDPEEDTPARLSEYAKRFRAGSQWSFYTGSVQASVAAQRAFDVYRGDKMNHLPATLFRSAPGQPWVRLDGFATPDILMGELQSVLAAK